MAPAPGCGRCCPCSGSAACRARGRRPVRPLAGASRRGVVDQLHLAPGDALLGRLSRCGGESTTIRSACRYAVRSSHRDARSTEDRPSSTSPVAVAPSGRMSCSHRTIGPRRPRAFATAGSKAGKDGETERRQVGPTEDGVAAAARREEGELLAVFARPWSPGRRRGAAARTGMPFGAPGTARHACPRRARGSAGGPQRRPPRARPRRSLRQHRRHGADAGRLGVVVVAPELDAHRVSGSEPGFDLETPGESRYFHPTSHAPPVEPHPGERAQPSGLVAQPGARAQFAPRPAPRASASPSRPRATSIGGRAGRASAASREGGFRAPAFAAPRARRTCRRVPCPPSAPTAARTRAVPRPERRPGTRRCRAAPPCDFRASAPVTRPGSDPPRSARGRPPVASRRGWRPGSGCSRRARRPRTVATRGRRPLRARNERPSARRDRERGR